MREPVLELVFEPVVRCLADADDGGAGFCQRTGELALVGREERLDKDHVHEADAIQRDGRRLRCLIARVKHN